MKFAKLFEIDEVHQLLLTKDVDDSDEDNLDYLITARCHVDGVKCSLTLGYDSEENRDEKFENIDFDSAKNLFSNLTNSFLTK
jgi:hypothetical protein